MKLSQFIAELQYILDTHGDLTVMIFNEHPDEQEEPVFECVEDPNRGVVTII